MTTKSYGAWITKDSIVEVVRMCDHEHVAAEYLASMFHVSVTELYDRLEKLSCVVNNRYTYAGTMVYNVMFRLGYVRVVFEHDHDYIVEYSKRVRHNRYQKDWIMGAAYANAMDNLR